MLLSEGKVARNRRRLRLKYEPLLASIECELLFALSTRVEVLAVKPQIVPRKQPRQARSKAMVDTILDATARVLVRDSYAKASTNAVAEAAGISVGSLYQYFPNKDSLIMALHERHVREVHSAFVRDMDNPRQRPLKEAVGEMIHLALEAHRVDPLLHKVLESEVPHLLQHAHGKGVEADFHAALLAFASRYKAEITVQNLSLAAFVVGQIVHVLVHSAVIDPPPDLDVGAIEGETVRAVCAYLTSPAQ